jgi:hypothetical protein
MWSSGVGAWARRCAAAVEVLVVVPERLAVRRQAHDAVAPVERGQRPVDERLARRRLERGGVRQRPVEEHDLHALAAVRAPRVDVGARRRLRRGEDREAHALLAQYA